MVRLTGSQERESESKGERERERGTFSCRKQMETTSDTGSMKQFIEVLRNNNLKRT